MPRSKSTARKPNTNLATRRAVPPPKEETPAKAEEFVPATARLMVDTNNRGNTMNPPQLHPPGAKVVTLRVIPTQTGFDGYQLREQGVVWEYEAELDLNGEPILPPWVVREEDYVDPEVDLPNTNLDARNRPHVRGGATGHRPRL